MSSRMDKSDVILSNVKESSLVIPSSWWGGKETKWDEGELQTILQCLKKNDKAVKEEMVLPPRVDFCPMSCQPCCHGEYWLREFLTDICLLYKKKEEKYAELHQKSN